MFSWAKHQSGLLPQLRLLYAIPNGGKRDAITASMLKAGGVKPGVPDMHLPCSRRGFNSLYIELKSKGEKPTSEQLAWHDALRTEGNFVDVCYSATSAIDVLRWYLECK